MSSVYDLSLVLLSKESPSPLAGSFPYLLSALQQVKCICLRAFASAAPSGPRWPGSFYSWRARYQYYIFREACFLHSRRSKKDHRLERYISHVGNLKTCNSSVNEKLKLVNILVSSLL